MKSKFKGNGKNRILAAIASAVMFCLVVLLIIVTRKTDAVADASVIINGKEYSQDNKMKILEIVSEDYYDELGPIIGNSSGSVKWDDIVAKATDKKVASNSDVQKNMDVYLQYVNGILLNGTNYNLCLEYKSGNSYNYYTTSNDAIQKVGTLDVDNIKLIFCKKDGNSYIPMTTKNGSKLRDAFSFFVFGDKGMEGFVDLVIKKPSEVTTKDIDDATIVYFSCKIHNAGILSAYNYLNGTNVSSTEKKWTLGDNDLSAETALYLYMLNATKGKAIMYNSADKGLGSDNKYSNIARICLTMSGIDRDQFVTDFAHTKEGISGGVTGKYYSGNVGYINIDDENGKKVINYYLESGEKRSFEDAGGSGPFAYWRSYQMIFEPENFKNNKSDWVTTFPIYNATETNRQKYIDKYVWEFNSDNAITSELMSSNVYPSNAQESDIKYGTTYDEAKTFTKDNKTIDAELTGAKIIQYIIGAYKRTPSESVNVLEIEPIGVYGYNTDGGKDIIKTWYGLPKTSSVTVNVTSMSINAFAGLNEDILSKYDLVIIGDRGSAQTVGKVFGSHMYNTDRTFTESSKTYNLNANDLTEKAFNKLFEFAQKGMPIALDKNVYYGNKSVVDSNTNMYKMRKSNLAMQLTKTGSSNIVWVDNDEISDTLNYIYKPTSNISPNMQEYDGTEASVNERDFDKSLLVTFSGNVTVPVRDGSYKVKIYIDRNCDSMFSEDHTTDDTELFYCESDGTGIQWTNGGFSTTLSLPSGLTGYVGWKVEITDTDTGLRTYTSGAFALKNKERTINVLQIKSNSQESHLNLAPGSKFDEKFKSEAGITGFNLKVKEMTKTVFSEELKKNPKLLDDYSMIVMGFADNYGNDNDLSADAIDAIKTYIDDGKSVLMTHDCMSYRENGTGKKAAGSYEKLNYATQQLKPLIGMKGGYSLTDTLIYKLSGVGPFTGSGNTTNTRMTSSLSKLNTGEVTSYPYGIDSSISVAPTHAQYFALNLETQVNGSDPVVWYTLDNGDKNYFSLSGQDAVNNYYIYSAGNVTYTSAGHSDMDKEGTDAEMELFVNTFVRAILAGNSAPQVSYTDAVYDDTQKAYSSYIKYNYTKFADRKLNFSFKITDADLIDGRGIIKEAFMYVYNEEKRGDTDIKDGKFDSSKDKRLGYISIDGSGNVSLTSMPVSSGSSKVKSGVEYTVDNFWSLSGADDASLRQKLSDGTLKIGIQATDGHNGVGYAILNLQVKDLFNMD